MGAASLLTATPQGADQVVADDTVLPYPFTTADELLDICQRESMSISDVMLANELVWRSEAELREKLWHCGRSCASAWTTAAPRKGSCPAG